MLDTTSNSNSLQTNQVCNSVLDVEPQLRSSLIKSPDDYGIPLPDWLYTCIKQNPPGLGETCPTNTEALLAAAFDLAFQLHEGQFIAKRSKS